MIQTDRNNLKINISWKELLYSQFFQIHSNSKDAVDQFTVKYPEKNINLSFSFYMESDDNPYIQTIISDEDANELTIKVYWFNNALWVHTSELVKFFKLDDTWNTLFFALTSSKTSWVRRVEFSLYQSLSDD